MIFITSLTHFNSRYQLSDNIDNKFTIYPDTGRIATRVPLDREQVSEYTLEVIAMDTSLLPRSATTTVKVFVDDVNDNTPNFKQQKYTRSLPLPANQGKTLSITNWSKSKWVESLSN